MFINTVSSSTNGNNQEYYDSRTAPKKVVEEVISSLTEKEVNKIQSMVELYNKNQTVYCRISTINEDILGIPVKLLNNILTIKTSETLLLDIELSKVKSVEIIHF